MRSTRLPATRPGSNGGWRLSSGDAEGRTGETVSRSAAGVSPTVAGETQRPSRAGRSMVWTFCQPRVVSSSRRAPVTGRGG